MMKKETENWKNGVRERAEYLNSHEIYLVGQEAIYIWVLTLKLEIEYMD